MTPMTKHILPLLIAAFVMDNSSAQPATTSTPAKPAKETPALAGPRVHDAQEGKTLVHLDYEGKLRDLDALPEEAALPLLDLDDAEKARTDAVLTSYAARLDAIVADNLALLIKVQTSKGGPRGQYVATLKELAAILRPLRENGGLHVEILGALPEDKRSTYESIVKEHWDAAI